MHEPPRSTFSFSVRAGPGLTGIAILGLLLSAMPGYSYGDDGYASFEKFRKFEQIYEPSGVQQLPDGRFVVVEDEAVQPMDVFSMQADGHASEYPLYRSSLLSWSSPNRALSTLNDLEALTVDDQGYIYAITSHSRKESGKHKDSREQLARFRLEGTQIIDYRVFHGLLDRISAQFPTLRDAAKIRDVKDDSGFNIEGLGFDASRQALLIGLRSPLSSSDAIIVVLENPQVLFDRDEQPRLAERLITLDLDGGGIRALEYDPHLGGFLVIGGKPGNRFKLWLWSGDADQQPRRIRIATIKKLHQAEGVTPVVFDGRAQGILIVSDDGAGSKSEPGRYLFLRYDQLEID